jgi:hypothetical protein
MNTLSAHEYTVFEPAQHLRNCREQRPSDEGDLDSGVSRKVGRVYYRGVDLLRISFLYCRTRLFLGCVSGSIPCSIEDISNKIRY